MAIEKGIAHRPGAFKQTNKEHKHGRHRSKGSISISAKDQRRNQAIQIRQKKRDEVLAKKRGR
ncbi:hypothetical protein NQ318_016489 [Aromia moschata]|uniref:Uncharacterized protein n=1 Tax=Aromia moschata TaxID=1265417 RepID=A0AAV8X5U7_9CUCU|nr:hypothetical protein NQ318_016489 [Aromia moschata]